MSRERLLPPEKTLEKVARYEAHLSRKNLQAVESVGRTPFVPFKSNTLPEDDSSVWARMYHYFTYNREKFLQRVAVRMGCMST